ncbi:MAG: SPOR domain-containing protein [Chloroflexi bacterium]|nr:SPOR domain-containing protein [Chloroflexota bacterium]
MSCRLPENIYQEGTSCPGLWKYWGGLVLLFLMLFSSVAVAAVATIQPIRVVKVIDHDEAGFPIRFPAALAYDPTADEIYITSPLKNKLVLLTSDYFPYLSIGSGRGLKSLSGSYLKDGMLYVCVGASSEDANPHIAVYDSAFLPQKKIYFPEQLKGFSPLDLVVGKNGHFYLVGFSGTGVVVLDPEGHYLRTIEPRDEVLGVREKAPILALDVDQEGNLYFVSEAMGRVFVYDRDERFLYKFGEKGGDAGKLSRPRGIALDNFRQQVYIVDYQRHTVGAYAMTGEYLFEIGGMGQGRGWFYYPNDILVDGRGRLLVADTFNHRVQVFEFTTAPVPARPLEREELVAEVAGERAGRVVPVAETETIAINKIVVTLPDDAVGDFLVLVLISRQEAEAITLANRLAGQGDQVHIAELDMGKRGTWYQVLIGPYVDPLQAHAAAEKFRHAEQSPTILKTRGDATSLQVPLGPE